MHTAPPQPPEWFSRAIHAPQQSRTVDVEGCAIHYLSWGDSSLPGLLFVGASGGHAHWYDHIAPLLTDQFHVAAIDLAGCGDSGRREEYSQRLIVQEIVGVLADCGMLDKAVPPTVVGHSGGAQCAVRTAMAHGGGWLGVIAVDGLRYAELPGDHAIAALSGPRPQPRPPRVYETLEEAIARFRLTPAPLIPIGNDYIIRHIARHSFTRTAGGWTSKFDTRQTLTVDLAFELTGALKDLPCQAASLYAQHSHLADAHAGAAVSAMNDGRITSFILPGSSHYPPIDNPFGFVAAIKSIALTWMAQRNRATPP